MIEVNYNKHTYKINECMKVIDFIKTKLKIEHRNIMACKLFNEVKSLDYVIDRNCKLELLDTSTSDGNRIYVRGLTFILAKAFNELFPNHKFIVNYSLGHSLFCEVESFSLKAKDISIIKKKMQEIIDANISYEKKTLTLEEAMKIYSDLGREDKVGLLETRMKTHVSMYYCEDYFNYFYGVMPLSTGYTKVFDLKKYENGLLLMYPRRFSQMLLRKILNLKNFLLLLKNTIICINCLESKLLQGLIDT